MPQTKGPLTAKEGLSLDTTEAALGIAPELQPIDVDDALSVDKELQLSVGFTDVVKTNALRNSVPLTRLEVEGTPTDGSTIGGVAFREGGNAAQPLVGLETCILVGGKVGVQFTRPLGSPHETSGPAPGVTSSTGA